MKAFVKSGRLLMLALLIFASVTTALAQRQDDASEERLEVQKAFANFIEAFNNLEWESFRKCFADDASVFNPAIPEVTELHRLDGREKIERIFQAVFAEKKRGSHIHRTLTFDPLG